MAEANMTLITLENLSQFKTNYDSQIGYTGTEQLMTDAEQTKLAGIADGAEVNVIDEVQLNGTPLTVSSKAVNIDLSDYALKTDLVNGVTYKGSVTNYSELASLSPEAGDIYQVTNADPNNDIEAGEFVIYNGTTWEDLGGTLDVDISDYYTKTEADGIFQTIAELEQAVEDAGFIKTEDVDLSEYLTSAEAASTYLTITDAESTYAKLTDLGGYYDTASYPVATETDITGLFS